MARYRLLITLAIVSLAFAAYGDQPVFAPRDPSAARKDFSNVDPSTAIDALNLGTMASEAKTDYVATGTFTDHTGDSSDPHGATLTQTTIVSDSVDGVDVSAHVTDNSDVHGCTAIASASAVADALSAANASDALCLRLDGSRAMTGNLKFSGNYGILQSTDDGTDNGYSFLAGGGTTQYSRGGFISVYGNEYATVGGQIKYYAGNVSSGDHVFYTGEGPERFRIGYDGTVKCFGETNIGNGVLVAGSTNEIWSQPDLNAAGTLYINFCGYNKGATQYRSTGIYNGKNQIIAMFSAANKAVLIGTTTDDGTNKLQVDGSVAISSFMQLASPTAIPTPSAGRIYFNGTEAKFKKCLNGSTWVDM